MHESRGGSRINFRVLQNFTKKSITIRCVKSRRFYCRLFWPKLHRIGDIMALAWVVKLSEQRAIFKNLLSFCLYFLLHGIIKTFINSVTRLAFVQYKLQTFSGHLEDINLLFEWSSKYLSNTVFFQLMHIKNIWELSWTSHNVSFYSFL